jgi:hypothetical protein
MMGAMPRPRLVPTALLLAALGLAAGCGDDGDAAESGDAPESETTTEAPPADDEAGDEEGGEDDGEAAVGDVGECAEAAEAASPDEALAAFPDNPDVTWAVLGSREGGLGTVLVEIEPDPDEVGYPSFTFVFSCGDGTPERLATYALDGGDYVLLATTDAATGIDFAPVLEE